MFMTLDLSNHLKCIFQHLQDHLEHLKTKLVIGQSAVYIRGGTRSRRPIDKLSLITETLHNTFSEVARKRTLDHLRIFSKAISQFHSKYRQGSPLVPLDDVYDLMPSLRALVNLHYEYILNLPHYDSMSQSPFWCGSLDEEEIKLRASQVVPWLGRRDLFPPHFQIGGLPTSPPATDTVPSWRPRISRDQVAIAFGSRRVKKVWEAVSKSGSTASGPTSTDSIDKTPTRPHTSTQSTSD